MLHHGTEGAFNLIADAVGSDVSLIYNINIDVSGIPENLKFYTDEARSKKVIITDGKMKIEDFIGVNDTEDDKQQIKTVYWKWEYQTGMSEYEKTLEDEKDSAWMGKNIQMRIDVTGKQVAKKPVYLADNVEIGSYVGYDASSDKIFSDQNCLLGSNISAQFNSNDTMKWRVLYIDQLTKTVELMSEEPTTQIVTFTGKNGYHNAEKVLNQIGSIYGDGNGAVNGRSINIEDIMQYCSYDPYTYENSHGYHYGQTVKFSSGTYLMEDGTEKEASKSNKVNMTYTHYITDNAEKTVNFFSDEMYSLLFKKANKNDEYKLTYWISSRCVYIDSICRFSVRRINSGFISCPTNMYISNGEENSNSCRVVPIVTLNANIKTKGQDDNMWQLDI